MDIELLLGPQAAGGKMGPDEGEMWYQWHPEGFDLSAPRCLRAATLPGRDRWNSSPRDGKYRTLSGVLSKLPTVRYGSEETEPHR